MDIYQEPFKELVLLEGYLDYDHNSESPRKNGMDYKNMLPEWLELTEVKPIAPESIRAVAEMA